MKWFFLTTLLILLSLLEGLLTTTPFVLGLLICVAALYKKKRTFFLALISGLMLDLLFFKPLGLTAAAFIIILFVLFLYNKNFETHRIAFVLIFSFISSLIYCFLFSLPQALISAILLSVFAAAVFLALQILAKPKLIEKDRHW